jgi:hypothetical protein
MNGKPKYQVVAPINFDDNTSIYGPGAAPQIKPMPGCFAVMATNTGDTIVRVNDIILYPGVIGTNVGESTVIGGHYGYEYKGFIRIVFNTPAGAQPEVAITQLFVPKEQNV